VDLGNVIYNLVLNYLPNSLVTIERNGVGTGTLAQLMKSKIRNNLYFEIKERTIEERLDGFKANKRKQMTKVYGVDNTQIVRERLMDLLTDRVRDHYDKFVSPVLFEELKNLELKKTGKIDHSANSHDDGLFSFLYAIYPLYYGKNVRENWHISIPTLKTADDEAEEIFQDYSATEAIPIVRDIENLENDDMIQEQLSKLDRTKLYQQFLSEQQYENDMAMARILATKTGRDAYADKFNIPRNQLDDNDNGFDMLTAIDNFYSEDN
jgi:hypothetical protein